MKVTILTFSITQCFSQIQSSHDGHNDEMYGTKTTHATFSYTGFILKSHRHTLDRFRQKREEKTGKNFR